MYMVNNVFLGGEIIIKNNVIFFPLDSWGKTHFRHGMNKSRDQDWNINHKLLFFVIYGSQDHKLYQPWILSFSRNNGSSTNLSMVQLYLKFIKSMKTKIKIEQTSKYKDQNYIFYLFLLH